MALAFELQKNLRRSIQIFHVKLVTVPSLGPIRNGGRRQRLLLRIFYSCTGTVFLRQMKIYDFNPFSIQKIVLLTYLIQLLCSIFCNILRLKHDLNL